MQNTFESYEILEYDTSNFKDIIKKRREYI